MSALRTRQVFAPAGQPQYTYLDRNNHRLDADLNAAKDNICKLVSVTASLGISVVSASRRRCRRERPPRTSLLAESGAPARCRPGRGCRIRRVKRAREGRGAPVTPPFAFGNHRARGNPPRQGPSGTAKVPALRPPPVRQLLKSGMTRLRSPDTPTICWPPLVYSH